MIDESVSPELMANAVGGWDFGRLSQIHKLNRLAHNARKSLIHVDLTAPGSLDALK